MACYAHGKLATPMVASDQGDGGTNVIGRLKSMGKNLFCLRSALDLFVCFKHFFYVRRCYIFWLFQSLIETGVTVRLLHFGHRFTSAVTNYVLFCFCDKTAGEC